MKIGTKKTSARVSPVRKSAFMLRTTTWRPKSYWLRVTSR
jgi:hypothetical protein